MALTLVTAPLADPVSVADIRAHLRIDSELEDALLVRYLQAALNRLEGRDGWLNRAFITQTWDWTLDGFPSGAALSVPLPPLQSVVSIQYIDTEGFGQTMSALDYVVDTKSEPGWIAPAYGRSFPSTQPAFNTVTIRFVCGYGPGPTAVPAAIRLALLGMVGDAYEHRVTAGDIPDWVNAYLVSFKVY
jgi:uncharacterized phiE125 gp8 family phage protein